MRFSETTGGLLTWEDFARARDGVGRAVKTVYKGYDVWEIPPSTQGIVALIALNILDRDDFLGKPRLSAEVVHLIAEALKLAFADAYEHIADPASMRVRMGELLSEAYAGERREQPP